MIESHKKCLAALFMFTRPDGEMCVPFATIQNQTGYDRQHVRRYVRALARKGLAEYYRGLWTEDGYPAGAGYCISKGGVDLYTESHISTEQEDKS